MRDTILILTNTEDDLHVKPVIEKLLSAGQKVFRFDVDLMTADKTHINVVSMDNRIEFAIINRDATVNSNRIKSVWYRRPSFFQEQLDKSYEAVFNVKPPHFLYIEIMLYNFDLKKIKQKKIIILGETHGVAENVEIVKTFVDSLEAEGISVTIALEWPTEINSDIQAFLSNKEIEPSWRRWSFVQDKDGRVSKEHIAFLQWLKARNKILLPDKKHNIFCFSEEQESWNTRDLKMAQNIKSILNNRNQKVILAVMGNLHARKKEVKIDGKICAPLATHLPKKDIVAFKCDYFCGSFFNHTLKFFKSRKECDNKSIFIKPAPTKEFDYHIITPCAHAVTLLGSSS